MALLKASVPGMVILSPIANPEIEMIKFWSNALAPVTVMPAKLYCWGVFVSKISNNLGSMDTAGRVSFCANAHWVLKTATIINK